MTLNEVSSATIIKKTEILEMMFNTALDAQYTIDLSMTVYMCMCIGISSIRAKIEHKTIKCHTVNVDV